MTLLIALVICLIAISLLGITTVIQRSRVLKTQVWHRKQNELLPEFGDHDRLQASLAALKILPGDIELGPRLGHGTFGEVYKGMQHLADDTTLSTVACQRKSVERTPSDIALVGIYDLILEVCILRYGGL